MWEVTTLGGIPYGTVSVSDLQEHLKIDRLPMTPNTPAELYALMTSTWQVNPTARPNMNQILDQLKQAFIGNLMRTPKVEIFKKKALGKIKYNNNMSLIH